ncbi:MAG: hypothetical protein ACQESG_05460 [Nanobdellota archaeon]
MNDTKRAQGLASMKRFANQAKELEDDTEFCKLLEELENYGIDE